MSVLQVSLVLSPALLLLAAGLLPSRFADRHKQRVRRGITWLAGVQCISALIAAMVAVYATLAANAGQPVHFRWPEGSLVSVGVYYDSVASLMLLLVSFVGFVVCKYSIRYLDGEATQGRYFRWVGMTIGAVSLLVISGNLLMFFAAWVMTSFGLHCLLLYYPDRSAVRRAAWTKFSISRLGDCFLIAAIVLMFHEFGTFEFAELFAAVEGSSGAASHSATAIAWLLMLGAVTKSAQFPLHTWLPETMETPTPVSALMHAGIVNAGGYLVIRLSPLIVQAPAALMALATIGTVTVCFAGVVMLTQTSVKRSLAYSTIAQMGFMMLQCGLGAFSAALLHIIAHSLYKAHAFLNSGNVLAEAARTELPRGLDHRTMRLVPVLTGGLLAALSIVFAATLFGVEFAEKSGGYALGFVLWLALAGWLWDMGRLRERQVAAAGILVAPLLAFLYMAGFSSVDALVSSSLPAVPFEVLASVAGWEIVFAFCGLCGIHWLLSNERGRAWLAPLHVHVANGFYVDAVLRRVFGPLFQPPH